MMHTSKLLDGYILNTADGYSINSDWVDVHSSPFFSISVVFSNGNPDGYVTLQCSNDQSSDEVARGTYGSSQYVPIPFGVGLAGKNYPVSAGSSQGTPIDLNTVSDSSTQVLATGTVTYNTQVCGYRWVRVSYAASVNAVTTVTILMHRKSQIGRVGG